MEAFRASLKELHRALCVAPKWQSWDEVLNSFRWTVRPFRATPGLIDRKLKFWTEIETSAADSSLFTSSGVWKSPKTAPTFFVVGVLILATAAMQLGYSLEPNLPMEGCIDNPDAGKPGEYCTWNFITTVVNLVFNTIGALLAFTVAASLRFYGDSKTAQRVAILIGGLCAVFGTCAAIGVFTSAWICSSRTTRLDMGPLGSLRHMISLPQCWSLCTPPTDRSMLCFSASCLVSREGLYAL